MRYIATKTETPPKTTKRTLGLEMPWSEVSTRFDILHRWAMVLKQHGTALPEGFDKQLKEVAGELEQAKTQPEYDFGPVLLFIEESVDALQKAAGMTPMVPSARSDGSE